MLQIKNITKKYSSDSFEQIALNNVSMNFRNSEFVSILGQSGSGKTTLLNIIGGLDKYTSGDLIINGVSTRKYTDRDWDSYRNHSIGFVFQSYNLIGHQSVLSNVEMALTLSGVKKSERKSKALYALTQVGLADHVNKRPNQLSGGQMQRVAIARALVNNPDIILADEPTGALDSDTSVQIMDILKQISKDKLVIMVTHNPELADEYSTRIIRLKDGKIVGDTNPYSNENYARDNGIPINTGDSMSLTQRTHPLFEARLSGRKMAGGVQNTAPIQPITPKQPAAPPPKTSMNFLTALSLSFNNLLTKKGRTALTAFAGSIGIIGIALILALSTGVNNYITSIQQDTLASYPIQILKESQDIGAAFSSAMDMALEDASKAGQGDTEYVYGSATTYDTIKSMLITETTKNNLKPLKEYLEKEENSVILKENSNAIQYGYDLKLNLYAKDEYGQYSRADFKELVEEAMGGENGGTIANIFNGTNLKIWEELITDENGEVSQLITDKYDLIHGKWPTEANEIVVILDANNEIPDLALYALGLIDKETMKTTVLAALAGSKETDKYKDIIDSSWSFSDICKIKLKMVFPTDFYQYDKNLEKWIDVSNDETIVKSLIEKGTDIKVCGIIKLKPDAEGTFVGALCYSSELKNYYIEKVNNSEIVKQQTSSEFKNKSVLDGMPFVSESKTNLDLSDSEKVSIFKEFISKLTPIEKADLYQRILENPGDKAIQEEVDEAIKKYQDMTAEEIIEDMKKNYGSQAGYSTDVVENMFKDYTKEELIEFLTKTTKDAITSGYKLSADSILQSIKRTPNKEELDKIINEIKDELFASIAEQPESQQSESKFAIKIGYITQNWLETTGLSEEAIVSYLYTLSSKEVNEIFEKVLSDTATEIYANYGGAGSESDNTLKIANAFDEFVKTCKDEDFVKYYNNGFTNQVSSKNKTETLEHIGYCSLDTPTFINIYPKDFKSKENIIDLIEKYNESVEKEEDKIVYTDMMEYLMSSVSTIINAISIVLICFVAISLVVSSIMIGIITYISVLERTKEIGILRAVGASQKDISRVFNAETFIVGLLSGIVGIGTTIVLCIPISMIARSITEIDNITASLPWYGYLLVVLSIGLTLIAGLFPAMMAAKKDPVVALRSE